ncbi:hypothetical protein ACLK1T_13950 [Escherichia coli]
MANYLLIARFCLGTRHYYDACRSSGDHELTGCAYPQIAPPTITVSATYPGADAQTVEDRSLR